MRVNQSDGYRQIMKGHEKPPTLKKKKKKKPQSVRLDWGEGAGTGRHAWTNEDRCLCGTECQGQQGANRGAGIHRRVGRHGDMGRFDKRSECTDTEELQRVRHV